MFSVTASYALRILSCLAQLPENSSLPGHELARRTSVPVHYLSKMLQSLGKAGMVSAVRGTGGGYRLLPDAVDIALIDIVEVFDGPRTKPNCLMGPNQLCSDDNPCAAHHAWRRVRDSYVHFLESTTLADISGTSVRGLETGVERHEG